MSADINCVETVVPNVVIWITLECISHIEYLLKNILLITITITERKRWKNRSNFIKKQRQKQRQKRKKKQKHQFHKNELQKFNIKIRN